MGWWRLDYNLSERERLQEVLSNFTDAVRFHEGADEFYRTLLTQPEGVPGYFRQLFERRGIGGSWYSQNWQPISEGWRDWKAEHGYDTRIGFRTGNLFRSLTQPGNLFNYTRISKYNAEFGSKVVDTEKGMHDRPPSGESYAGKFNRLRPIIDDGELQNLKHYLVHGGGVAAFNRAVEGLKKRVIGKAVRGLRRNRFGNVFPQ